MKKKLFIVGLILLVLVMQTRPFQAKKNFYSNMEDYEQIHAFFTGNMLNKDGGVYTNFMDTEISTDDEITKGHYVLSESQGLLLEYAILINDQELFLRTWDFLEKYMMNEDGSFVWRVSGAYERTNESTATIDDLQIILQLINAQKVWPELKEELEGYIQNFVNNFSNYMHYQYLVNGYDTVSGEKILELDSSYIYLRALKELEAFNKEAGTFYRRGVKLLDEMKISKEFPFVYKRFFVSSEMIEKREEINMIEALLVSRNLSQTDQLDKSTLNWINKRIDSGIYAYYNSDGEPVGNIESSAVYGLIAQIAYYENDTDLYEKALTKGSVFLKEAISAPKEHEIMSYDNLQMLIAFGLGKSGSN